MVTFMLTAAEEFNTHSKNTLSANRCWRIQYSFNFYTHSNPNSILIQKYFYEMLQSAASCYNLLTAAQHSIQLPFNLDSILIQLQILYTFNLIWILIQFYFNTLWKYGYNYLVRLNTLWKYGYFILVRLNASNKKFVSQIR